MGIYHTDPITTLTFILLVFIVTVADCDQFEFLQEYQFKSDVSKTNISQTEYVEKMRMYLDKLEESQGPEGVPKLLTYYSDNRKAQRRKETTRLHFLMDRAYHGEEIESTELKILFPKQTTCNRTVMQVYEVLNPRKRRLLNEKQIYLSTEETKWAEFDVTEISQRWMSGGRKLGLEIRSVDCRGENLKPVEAAINVVVLSERQMARKRRSAFDPNRRTDCSIVNSRSDRKGGKCCRYDMHVNFKKLNLSTVIQPKSYEAGFCKGRCPLNFNHATNHSRIQNLMHKLDRRSTPRACCAPSVLEPIEILMVDPHDSSKLSVERWENMIVVECACS